MPITQIDYEDETFQPSELPPEVLQYESDVLNGKIKVEDTKRNKKWIRGLQQINIDNKVSSWENFLKGMGAMFVSLSKPAEVTAKAPTPQKTNYTPYIVAAAALILFVLLKK